MNKSLAYVLLFMLNSFAFSQTSDFYSYHIGNSLTWDANPPSFKNIAAHAGYKQEVGYQIVPGQPLNYIWNNPTDYAETAEPYTTFDNALPNYTWDAVTFQPFSGGGSTLGTDKQVILNMIDMALQNSANYNTQFYIYAAYPNQTVTTEDADGLTIDYSSEWLAASSGQDSQATIRSRDYYYDLLDQVNAERPENVKPLKIIPVGEVIYQLEQKMKDGLVPGFNEAEDLYRDQFHLDNVGRFIAGTTFFATLFDEDPTPLSEPGEYWYLPNSETWGDVDSSISPELADIIQTTAWEVVSTQVPEPLTFMSLGTCMIGFIWSRKGK